MLDDSNLNTKGDQTDLESAGAAGCHSGMRRRTMVYRTGLRRVVGAVLVLVAVAGLGLPASALRASAQSRSARAGIYTGDQAKRGKVQFLNSCATCHLDDLSGSDRAPPLVGETFMAYWGKRTVGELVDRMQTTMPQGDPGTLSRKTCLDIATYLLQVNDYPTGQQELKDDSEALQHITMK